MLRNLVLGLVLGLVMLPCAAQERFQPELQMVTALDHFLKSLNPEVRENILYGMGNKERLDWHYVPKERSGISFLEMNPQQKILAHAFINTGLSHNGYLKATSIMFLDSILYKMEGNNPIRNSEKFHLTFFGQPSQKSTWAWRFEGHHLSLNFTLKDGTLVSHTPLFMGANPAKVPEGPHQGWEVLEREEELGLKLVNSCDDQQREKVIVSENAPRDIVTRANTEVDFLEPRGLYYSEMNDQQKEILKTLVKEYIYRVRPDIAEKEWQDINQNGWDHVSFGWAGGLERGQGHYYRIQGPTFIVEFDNTQNNANHIHTVWRNPQKDFGRDVLKEHYQAAH